MSISSEQAHPDTRWGAVEEAGSDQVAEAVYVLNQDREAWLKYHASNWLRAFQESLNSWSVADKLLRENRNIECSYFAAQTMRTKIKYSFHELPLDAHASLRDSLISHVQRITEETNQIISTQLCLALADLALQMTTWTNPVDGLLNVLSSTNVWALLEILTVIPEEATSNSLRLTVDRRRDIERCLLTDSRAVCEFLKRTLGGSEGNVQLSNKVIGCLSSWFSARAVSLFEIGENVIVAYAFRVLVDPTTYSKFHKTAADCVCNLLKCLEENNNNEEVEMIIFNGVISLEQSYHLSVANEDQEKALNYSRIFTELGESFLDKVINYSVTNEHCHFAIKTLDLVLICVGHHDYEVAEISFNLWYRLSEELYKKDDNNLISIFVPYIERLINALCRHCQMEPDHRGLLDKGDEFYEFRQKAIDLTKDVVFIVGSNHCLKRLFFSLQVPNITWEQTEATLFIMHALAKSSLPEEYEVVPKVVEAILAMPDNAHIAVRHTSILLLGELCDWIGKHLECLPATLEYLNIGLQNSELSSAAGHALQNICSSCRNHMGIHLPGLIQIVRNLDSFNLSSSAALDILRGVATVISRLEQHDQITSAMKEICHVQLVSLAASNNEVSTNDDTMNKKDSIIWLDRIAVIFRYCKVNLKENEPHPCTPVLADSWPVLSITMERYAPSTRVMERLCRCLRYILRSLGIGCLMLLDPLSKQMVTVYTQHMSSCFLYLGSILIAEFACDASSIPKLTSLVEALVVPAFELLQKPNALNANPDTVEDLFRLCQRFLEKLPLQFLQSQLKDSIIQCGLLACNMEHREANASVLQFFSELVRTAQSKNPEESQCIAIVNTMLNQQGEHIVKNLLHLSVFTSHTYVLSYVAEVVLELQIWNKNNVNQWIEIALRNFPQNHIIATSEQILKFYTNISQSETKSDITRALKDFSRLYH